MLRAALSGYAPFRLSHGWDLSEEWQAEPSRSLRMKERAVRLGIDIGGTKTALALGDAGGRVLADARIATAPSGDALRDLARIAEAARALLATRGLTGGGLEVVGVSLPGGVDARGGFVRNPPNLPGWHEAPVRDALATALGARVALENDANAAALAEWRFGAARGAQHAVYLTMSTGVGGGLILGGRLHRGDENLGGEVGHMPVVWQGEPCACGLRGCVEAYIGGAAWAKRLARETPTGSAVARLAAEQGVPPRPEHVISAVRRGDAFALAELARFNEVLAQTLCTLAAALAPEIFVLGTIVVAAGELCLGPVRELVRANSWPRPRPIAIEPAALGDRLPLLAGLGVAAEALREAGA
jgi:glucokinase